MHHIIFSPHLDDAVLCCGGMIAKFINAGDTVTNHTIFCGLVRPPYSPLAESFHKKWGNPKDMVRLRRAEDLAAGTKLGAEIVHDNYVEPIYRTGDQGEWLYHSIDDIFGDRHPNDNILVQQITKELGAIQGIANAQLYFPLGIGHHVDHIIMYEVGISCLMKGYKAVFYEDFPYTIQKNNFDRRREELPEFQSLSISLCRDDLNAKIEAFLYYRSQVPMLFGGFDQVPKIFKDFGRTVSGGDHDFGERLWVHPEFSNQRLIALDAKPF